MSTPGGTACSSPPAWRRARCSGATTPPPSRCARWTGCCATRTMPSTASTTGCMPARARGCPASSKTRPTWRRRCWMPSRPAPIPPTWRPRGACSTFAWNATGTRRAAASSMWTGSGTRRRPPPCWGSHARSSTTCPPRRRTRWPRWRWTACGCSPARSATTTPRGARWRPSPTTRRSMARWPPPTAWRCTSTCRRPPPPSSWGRPRRRRRARCSGRRWARIAPDARWPFSRRTRRDCATPRWTGRRPSPTSAPRGAARRLPPTRRPWRRHCAPSGGRRRQSRGRERRA
jgi:hypothetical protein